MMVLLFRLPENLNSSPEEYSNFTWFENVDLAAIFLNVIIAL